MKTEPIQNSLLKEISEKTGLILSENGKAVGGKYEDYNITINYFTEIFYIDIPIRATNECRANEINRFLNYIGNKYNSIISAQYMNYCIKVQCIREIKEVGGPTIILVLNEVVKFAKDRNLVPCCGNCGRSCYVIPFMKAEVLVPYCLDCQFNEKEVSTIKKKVVKVQGNNISTSILGAMTGALIGLTVWVLIARIGSGDYIGGFVIAVATITGYEIFGNRIDKRGLIISISIIIVTVFLAECVSGALKGLNKSMQEDNFIKRIIINSPYKIKLYHPGGIGAFCKDIFMGYLFTIVPIAYYITTKKKNKSL